MIVRGFLTLALAFAVGCTGSDKDEVTDTDPTTDPAETDASTDADDTGATGGAVLAGTVTGPDGAAVVDAALKYCRGLACATTRSDGAGRFSFDGLADGPGSFAVVPPAGEPWAHAFVPFDVRAADNPVIDVMFADRGAGVALPETEAAVEAGGIELTVAKAGIETPLLLEDATHFYAAPVHGTSAALPVQLAGDVLGLWMLEPHDYPIPAGAPVRVRNTFGVTDGASVTLYVGRYAESDWHALGSATIDGEWLVFPTELELVSTLALVQRPG